MGIFNLFSGWTKEWQITQDAQATAEAILTRYRQGRWSGACRVDDQLYLDLTDGFALMLWFLASMFRSALRRRGPPGLVGWAKLAALVACSGILVHSLADFNMHIPANAAVFYVLAALACVEEVEGSSHEKAIGSGASVLLQDMSLN